MSLNTLNLDDKFTELSGIFDFVYNTLKNNEEVQMNLKTDFGNQNLLKLFITIFQLILMIQWQMYLEIL